MLAPVPVGAVVALVAPFWFCFVVCMLRLYLRGIIKANPIIEIICNWLSVQRFSNDHRRDQTRSPTAQTPPNRNANGRRQGRRTNNGPNFVRLSGAGHPKRLADGGLIGQHFDLLIGHLLNDGL